MLYHCDSVVINCFRTIAFQQGVVGVGYFVLSAVIGWAFPQWTDRDSHAGVVKEWLETMPRLNEPDTDTYDEAKHSMLFPNALTLPGHGKRLVQNHLFDSFINWLWLKGKGRGWEWEPLMLYSQASHRYWNAVKGRCPVAVKELQDDMGTFTGTHVHPTRQHLDARRVHTCSCNMKLFHLRCFTIRNRRHHVVSCR